MVLQGGVAMGGVRGYVGGRRLFITWGMKLEAGRRGSRRKRGSRRNCGLPLYPRPLQAREG